MKCLSLEYKWRNVNGLAWSYFSLIKFVPSPRDMSWCDLDRLAFMQKCTYRATRVNRSTLFALYFKETKLDVHWSFSQRLRSRSLETPSVRSHESNERKISRCSGKQPSPLLQSVSAEVDDVERSSIDIFGLRIGTKNKSNGWCQSRFSTEEFW